jgi:hypothetical protein
MLESDAAPRYGLRATADSSESSGVTADTWSPLLAKVNPNDLIVGIGSLHPNVTGRV